MKTEEDSANKTDEKGVFGIVIPLRGLQIPAPLLCCRAVPTLRRVEFSVAYACRACGRMGEPGKSEQSAVSRWNRALEAAARG